MSKDSEDIDLSLVAQESLGLTQSFLSDIKASIAKKALNKQSVREKQLLSGLLTKLMRAAAALIKEARALEKDNIDAARKLTYEQKRKLVVEFIQMMPPEHQRALRVELNWHLAPIELVG